MNKKELINIIANEINMNYGICEKVINAFLLVSKDVLQKGGKISIKNFGKFYTTFSNERVMYNYLLKQKICIPSRIQVKFKSAKSLL